jgi:hypothetical protein
MCMGRVYEVREARFDWDTEAKGYRLRTVAHALNLCSDILVIAHEIQFGTYTGRDA